MTMMVPKNIEINVKPPIIDSIKVDLRISVPLFLVKHDEICCRDLLTQSSANPKRASKFNASSASQQPKIPYIDIAQGMA